MDILVCPVCKGKLVLAVTQEDSKEIISGTLKCGKCNVTYQIVDAIPNLLPPEKTAQSGR